jgi:cell division protein ZapA
MTAAEPIRDPRLTQSHVTVTINERQYRLACEPGQEAHLRRLAKNLDDRITGLRREFGEIGNARLTVMVGLMLADELLEAGRRIEQLEDEHTALQEARDRAADRAQAAQNAFVSAFDAAAERIESMAKKLNQAAGGTGAVKEAAADDRADSRIED